MGKKLKIGIIGLGLIGGSIFKALCNSDFEIFAVTKSQETIKKAKKKSQNVSSDLKIIKSCNIIFVCTPMNITLKILTELEKYVSKETIVTDVSSLKEYVSKQKRPYKFIPSHPMAGTEFKGFDASFETLFQGAKWVFTPIEKFDYSILIDIVKDLGATPIFCNPKEHDEAVALISNLPMVVAQAIFKAASENKLALQLASSGFRDMTRLALSNTEMASDMIKMNSENLENSVLKLYSAIGELLHSNYKNQVDFIKQERQKIYDSDGKNIL